MYRSNNIFSELRMTAYSLTVLNGSAEKSRPFTFQGVDGVIDLELLLAFDHSQCSAVIHCPIVKACISTRQLHVQSCTR